MGGAGSAWIKPKKRDGLRPDVLTRLPHPRSARPGQRYFPLVRAGRSRTTICVTRLIAGSDSATATREDGERRAVAVKLTRLLALDTAGRGRYYRFLGLKPGRLYATHAQIVELDGSWARLVCPEWHPELPITVALGSLPPMLRERGAWVGCRADLGAANPASVSPTAFTAPDTGFSALIYPPVAAVETPPPPTPPRSAQQQIVLFAAPPAPEHRLYLTGHPPPLVPGDRVLFCAEDQITGSCTIRACKALPNGVALHFEPDWQPLASVPAPRPPPSGVQCGRHGSQRWTVIDQRTPATPAAGEDSPL
jgi:hypothetical protein